MASTAAALLALSGLSCGGAAAPAAELPAESPSPEAVAQAVEPAPAPAPLPPLSVDLHVDTVTAMLEREIPWTDPSLEASLPALLESGVDVVVQAAWIPRRDPDPRGTALGKVRRIRNMVRQSQGRAAVVTGPEQLEQVVREGRLAVVIALEGGTALTETQRRKSLARWRSCSPKLSSSPSLHRSGGRCSPKGRPRRGAVEVSRVDPTWRRR